MNDNETNLILLVEGEKYPLPYHQGTGAATQFLVKGGSYLQVILPNMSQVERESIRAGEIKAGLLYKGGAMLFLFQFHDENSKLVMSFDSIFDVRLIEKSALDLLNIDNPEHRMTISIHGIDNGILRGMRLLTLPPSLTRKFLVSVQDQISTVQKGECVMTEWQKINIDELIANTETWILGN